MKKTVTVNIKGINFIIEEDAYEILSNYLKRLSTSLSNSDEGKEIIDDIELRISELCNLKLNASKQVIELDDIEQIIATLGNPEDYIEEPSKENTYQSDFNSSKTENEESNSNKRLFRDVENGKIAGVCSGLAAYFGIDPIIVRGIFLLIFFFGGFSIPLYIILWIITPRVNSSIDRLRMSGKKITVDSVKEEVENAANRFQAETNSFAKKLRNDGELKERISSIFRIFQTILGIGFIAFGTFLLFLFITVGILDFQILPIESEYGLLSINKLNHLLVENEQDYQWLRFSSLFVLSSIVLFVYVLGAKLAFRIRNKWSRILLSSLLTLAISGIFVCAMLAFKSGKEFTTESEIEKEVAKIDTKQLILNPILEKTKSKEFHIKSHGINNFIAVKGSSIVGSEIEIVYRKSTDSLFHIYQSFSARAATQNQAIAKAKNIVHNLNVDLNRVNIETFYTYPKKDKIRGQSVTVIIEIPTNKTVKFKNNTISLTKEWIEFDESEFENIQEGTLSKNGNYEHE